MIVINILGNRLLKKYIDRINCYTIGLTTIRFIVNREFRLCQCLQICIITHQIMALTNKK